MDNKLEEILDRAQELESMAKDLCAAVRSKMGGEAPSEDEYAENGDSEEIESEPPPQSINDELGGEEDVPPSPRKGRAALIITMLRKKNEKR